MEEKKVDRRVRKTKRQLRLALTKLLQEKPIKDITVREIADMVDINRGTFYLHYKDVYDMLEQVEAEMFEEFNQILNAQPSIVNAEKPLPHFERYLSFLHQLLRHGHCAVGAQRRSRLCQPAEGHCQGQMLSGNHRRV